MAWALASRSRRVSMLAYDSVFLCAWIFSYHIYRHTLPPSTSHHRDTPPTWSPLLSCHHQLCNYATTLRPRSAHNHLWSSLRCSCTFAPSPLCHHTSLMLLPTSINNPDSHHPCPNRTQTPHLSLFRPHFSKILKLFVWSNL